MSDPRLAVKIGRVSLKNPVVTASGTFGFAQEYNRLFPVSALGGITVKGLTLQPRAGNPPPRVVETPAGLLNAIGLQNPGLTVFLEKELPFLRELETTIIVNIAGFTIEEFARLASALDRAKGISVLELNISCPNVKAGGMAFGIDPEAAARVTRTVRAETSLPIWVKLSPNVTDIGIIAQAVEEAGAEAITLINTLAGMAIDLKKRRPLLGNRMGGLSGPAVKPIALRQVWQVYETVKIPLIGMGGISSPQDALEFMMAGASAVGVGTALFHNPFTPLNIIDGLCSYLDQEKIDRIEDIIGIAHQTG
ncbi:MAG TPA: dihydroorotate dehydrogenase [Firmicutes bacterium]|jgi:dihydroorotate dehydrogenase (NAD+) catalytic subunit|nr:dihydroorotate dehydrogenase [Bacillota bacterium]HBT16536.1 dihydroorotate dehydrogenase [Bacillota bacterium]